MAKVVLDDELLHPSDYISSFDLKGNDLTLTILSISKQELMMKGGIKKVKPVLTFKDHPKKMVCNKTNAESIAVMHGFKAQEWVGKAITLFPTTCKVGKGMSDCIRVREKAPQQAPARSEEDAVLLSWWDNLLDKDTINLEKMNGEVLATYLKMPKSPLRDEIWAKICEFGRQFDGFVITYNKAAKAFVQKPNE